MKASASHGVKVISALLTPIPAKLEEFLQTIQCLHLEIKKEPGCLDCVVGRDVDGGPRFLLFMVWRDLAALEAHMESENFRILLGATSVLSAPADFRFIAADSTCAQSEKPPTARSPERTRRPVPTAS
jgi:quinol monooxygenase YgiN